MIELLPASAIKPKLWQFAAHIDNKNQTTEPWPWWLLFYTNFPRLTVSATIFHQTGQFAAARLHAGTEQ